MLQQYDGYNGSTQFGRGKRTRAWDAAGRAAWVYDRAGRVTQEQRIVDGRQDAVGWQDAAADRVATQTDPDGEVLSSAYDPIIDRTLDRCHSTYTQEPPRRRGPTMNTADFSP